MDKETVYQILEQHFELFPNTYEEVAETIRRAIVALQKKKLAEVDNEYIIPIMQKEIPTATKRAKKNGAMTLKALTEEKEGVNTGMAHLQDLHPMTKSSHFSTLLKHGFIERMARGSYRLSKKGWEVLAKAHKISEEAKKPIPNMNEHGFLWIGQ